jgi:hypothetical protein
MQYTHAVTVLVLSPDYVEDEQQSSKDHSYQHNDSYED